MKFRRRNEEILVPAGATIRSHETVAISMQIQTTRYEVIAVAAKKAFCRVA